MSRSEFVLILSANATKGTGPVQKTFKNTFKEDNPDIVDSHFSAVELVHALATDDIAGLHIRGSVLLEDVLFSFEELGLRRFEPKSVYPNHLRPVNFPGGPDRASYPVEHYHHGDAALSLRTVPVHLEISSELLLKDRKSRALYIDMLLSLLRLGGMRPRFVCTGGGRACELSRLMRKSAARCEYTSDSQMRLFTVILQHLWRSEIRQDEMEKVYVYPRHDDVSVVFDDNGRIASLKVLNVYTIPAGALKERLLRLVHEMLPKKGGDLSALCDKKPYLAQIYHRLMGHACPREDDPLFDALYAGGPEAVRIEIVNAGESRERIDSGTGPEDVDFIYKMKRFFDEHAVIGETITSRDDDANLDEPPAQTLLRLNQPLFSQTREKHTVKEDAVLLMFKRGAVIDKNIEFDVFVNADEKGEMQVVLMVPRVLVGTPELEALARKCGADAVDYGNVMTDEEWALEVEKNEETRSMCKMLERISGKPGWKVRKWDEEYTFSLGEDLVVSADMHKELVDALEAATEANVHVKHAKLGRVRKEDEVTGESNE